MKLENIIKYLKVENQPYASFKDIIISGISYHSNQVQLGDLFVCIKGYQTDGHLYLKEAVKKGAVAAIVEEFQEGIEIPQIVVPNSRIALAKTSAYFYNHPSKKLKMIGVTATNGKTTTSFMINSILEKEGHKTGLIGTVMVKIHDHMIPAQLTTPESLNLQQYLRQMVDHNVTHACMEVSSNALETYRVEEVDYDIVTFNNLSRDHIDSHGSFEKYYDAKSRLIINAKESATAVLNLDDPFSYALINKTKANVVTYGIERNDGHITCKNLRFVDGRARFTVQILKDIFDHPNKHELKEFDVELSIPGFHSVYNALAAITVSLLCGASISNIQNTLKSFVGVERRFELIYNGQFKIFDDHFANKGNIHATLKTIQQMQYNQLKIVYAIRGGRGVTVNKENAEAIAEWAEILGIEEIVVTKSKNDVTMKDFVTNEEVEAFINVLNQHNIKFTIYDDLKDAIVKVLKEAKLNDIIILGGAQGMDLGAKIALEWLQEKLLFQLNG